jgi:DNA-binding FadR family transcriptional regulator
LVAFKSAATEHAAARRTRKQLAQIKAALDAMRAAIDRAKSDIEEDVAFHRAIVEASGYAMFRDISKFFDHHARKFIRIARSNTARFRESAAHRG